MKYNLELCKLKLENEDKSLRSICKSLNYPYVYINRLLCKEGYSCKNRKFSRRIDKEFAILLHHKYEQGIPIYKLAEEYNLDEMTISKSFKKFDLPYKMQKINININNNFFEEINTELKAYLLGFFAADGTINKNDNGMAIHIQSRDREVLDYYADAFNVPKQYYFYPAKKETHQPKIKLVIHSAINKRNLLALGFPPNKTYEMFSLPTDIMDENLIRHFVRGYFDGDGSIILPSKKSRVTKFKITSSNLAFLQYCKKVFEDFGCYNIKIEFPKNDFAKTLYIQNKPSIKLVYNYLYLNSNFYLKRKFDKMFYVAQQQEIVVKNIG